MIRALILVFFILLSLNAFAQDQGCSESQMSTLIFSAVSIGLALAAIVISMYTLRASKKHNMISVEPLLVFRPSTASKSGRLTVRIFNKGIGPLIFTKFEMCYDGKTFPKFVSLFHAIRMKLDFTDEDFDRKCRTFSFGLQDYALAINEQKILMKFQLLSKTKHEYRELYREIKEVEFIYSYRDLYGNESEEKRYKLRQHF